MNSPARNFKQQAHELVERLPDSADWKELAYEASVLQDIEEGLRDSDANRVVDNSEVRRQFGLDK
jgi:predicted transcriptional regulator